MGKIGRKILKLFTLGQNNFVSKILQIFCLCLFISSIAIPQSIDLSGTVKDASTNEPMGYVNVIISGSEIGTVSDIGGKFFFKLKKSNYEFVISSIGYKSEKVNINLVKDTTVNVFLSPTNILLQDVLVYSNSGESLKNENPTSISLQSQTIKEITSAVPDVMRSVQNLPGVTSDNEFNARYNVRGGNFDENLVLVNGTQVYEPFHIKEADNASIGIFNIDLIKRVDFIPGGFSARYGDRLSSVLNIEYRDGNRGFYDGAATLSLTNLDGFVEGPISSNSSFILGIRKSYLEYVLSLLDVNTAAKPSFYDVQGVINYNTSSKNKFQFKFIHAGDNFTENPEIKTGSVNYKGLFNGENANVFINSSNDEKNNAKYFSTLFDLQNKYLISNNLFINSEISYYNQLDNENSSELRNYDLSIKTSDNYFYNSVITSLYKNDLRIKTLEAKTSIDAQLNPYYEINSGFSYQNINFNQTSIDQDEIVEKSNLDSFPNVINRNTINDRIAPEFKNVRANSFKVAGFTENIFQVNDNLIFNIGGRIDYFDFNKDLTFSPRISGGYKIFGGVTIRGAWGIYYQSPIYRQLAYSISSDTNTQSQKAIHYILGIEKDFSISNEQKLKIKLEGYYKSYNDLIASTRFSNGSISYSRKNDSRGFAKGLDLYISLNLKKFYGWLSYGILSTKEENLETHSGEFPRYTDQAHTISMVGNFDFGKNWTTNVRFNYGSGFAYTPYYLNFNSSKNRYEWLPGNKNSENYPAYRRVDIRVSKEFILFDLNLIAFLDVSNLFNFKNVQFYNYTFNSDGNPQVREIELFPIIPSLGLTVKF